jgi:hypothetical protein
MVLHVALYLALMLSGIALIVVVLLADGETARGQELHPGLKRAAGWAGAVFLASAGGLVASTGEGTGSLLAGEAVLPQATDRAAQESAGEPSLAVPNGSSEP